MSTINLNFNEKALLNLKRQIEEAKARDSELRGQRQALLKQLSTNFQCNSIAQAKEMLRNLSQDIEQTAKQLEQKIEELNSQYNFL